MYVITFNLLCKFRRLHIFAGATTGTPRIEVLRTNVSMSYIILIYIVLNYSKLSF
jgi:hypothetical protein